MTVATGPQPAHTPLPGTAARPARFALVEQLLADGVEYVFGNPGTVEQGLLDSLEQYPQLHYINTLQETVAVAIADGYARATRRPTIVQLHSGVGLGNGIGMLYQAMRGHAPLVVLAGEAGIRFDAMDSQMAADLVAMAKPVTKWATRVVDSQSVLRVLRRAIKIAATPPMGPTFVCLPADVLDALSSEEAVPSHFPSTRVAPGREWLDQAALVLARASRPLIIMGDGIAHSEAQAELVQVAELLGAEVWGADHSEVNIPFDHPLYRGSLGHMFGSDSRRAVQAADAVLIVGTYVFPEVFPLLERPFGEATRIVHIDLNAYEIAKNFLVDLSVVADPKATLAALGGALESVMQANDSRTARERISRAGAARQEANENRLLVDRTECDELPLRPARLLEELARQLPPDVLVFDEALTVSPVVTRYLVPTEPDSYFQTRGGSLGVGIPGALGLKLAHPQKTVIGFSGDGGSMYTIQALWTAAHHGIGAKFVICNNGSYMLLKLNILQYWREQVGVEAHEFPSSFDLHSPSIDFAALAGSLGVKGERVDEPKQVTGAVERMLAHDGPYLIDMVIGSEVPQP
ncbi:MAG: thiamine pyrophosphate-binding protein [Trueperaceae bacterium]